MSDVGMTLNAGDVLPLMDTENEVCKFSVARLARRFGDEMVVALDLDIVRKSSGGEGERVEESVCCLDRVLAREIVWGVAIVAHGHGVMATLDPTVVVVLHDVAVGTGCGIVGEVGISPGVNKGVEAK